MGKISGALPRMFILQRQRIEAGGFRCRDHAGGSSMVDDIDAENSAY
jgi:hypothetical protein